MEECKPPAPQTHTHAPPRRKQQQPGRRAGGGGNRGGKRNGVDNAARPHPAQRPFARKWMMYAPPRSTTSSTVPLVADTFRVMSFNVLADYLAVKDSETDPSKLQRRFKWGYRCTRLVKEIKKWSPQVVCLQEVDHFEDFFEPELKKAGFVGVYKRRTGESTHDGCATFVEESKFRIVASHPIEYHVPGHQVLDRDNVALVAVVEAKDESGGTDSSRFLVANTHLLFNPGRGEIKLAQLEMLMKALSSLRQEHSTSDGMPMLPVLLCGDFNLSPHSALYHFISSGELDASGLSRYTLSGQSTNSVHKKAMRRNENDSSRHHGNGTAYGRFNSAKAQRTDFRAFREGSVFSHSLNFSSAYAQSPDEKCTGEPKFTIFHTGSKDTVDYIWFTRESLHCHGVVEMTPAGLLFKHQELPTLHHPSDHLSLVADFSLQQPRAT